MFKLFQKSKKKYSKEEIENYVKNKTLSRQVFGYEYCNNIYKLAKKLGSKYDDEILHASCYLHHIEQGPGYEEKSAKHADILLKRYLNEVDRYRVKEAILEHNFLGKPSSVEAILVHDAFLLSYLGPIGVLQITLSEKDLKLKEIAGRIKNIRAFSEKLILKQSISSAADKLQIIDLFIEALEKEI